MPTPFHPVEWLKIAAPRQCSFWLKCGHPLRPVTITAELLQKGLLLFGWYNILGIFERARCPFLYNPSGVLFCTSLRDISLEERTRPTNAQMGWHLQRKSKLTKLDNDRSVDSLTQVFASRLCNRLVCESRRNTREFDYDPWLEILEYLRFHPSPEGKTPERRRFCDIRPPVGFVATPWN